MTRKERFKAGKKLRLVIKVGSSLITTRSGRTNRPWLRKLVAQTALLRADGHQVVLVSSGAIAAGMEKLGLEGRPDDIAMLQSAAAVGQGILIRRYADMFSKQEIIVGQVLLTQFDTTHRQQYLNAQAALVKMLETGVVPVVNENDTTAVDEIRFGDNDTLAALVAVLTSSDALIILSDIQGLCTGDPRHCATTELIDNVDEITPEIQALASGATGKFGSGGMATKLAAARIAAAAGAATVIAAGREPEILARVTRGEKVGTFFAPSKRKLAARKIWIAYARAPMGSIVVDAGAKRALTQRGGSLLAAGITSTTGAFAVGDAVDVADADGNVFARGMANYSSKEIDDILGEVRKQGGPGRDIDEVVHRDCLAIL